MSSGRGGFCITWLAISTPWSLVNKFTVLTIENPNTIDSELVDAPVKNVQSKSRVTWSRVELLQSGRELTTKWGNNLGLSSCTVP